MQVLNGTFFALIALALSLPAHSATLTVTPLNLQGWSISADGTVPYTFGPPASIGSGSLQFGPIDGTAPANRLLVSPPITNLPAANFTSLAYDFYIDPGSIANSHVHMYTNVYIDLAANGIGAFAGGTGFYDCRYDYVPGSGAVGGWTTFTVGLSTPFTGRANRTGTCPATLGGLAASDQLIFVNLNGGQSTSSDTGLMGGFDNVVIVTSSGTDLYDFEPVSDVPEPSSLSTVVLALAGLIVFRRHESRNLLSK